MVCPKCGKKAQVIDSRETENTTRRRRMCTECDYRFSTFEYTMEDIKKMANKMVCEDFKKMLLYKVSDVVEKSREYAMR